MGAHLLPKLRCQFAEFLNRSYLKRLGILSPPTCVGLRYGQYDVSMRDFSWKHGINQLLRTRRFAATSRLSVEWASVVILDAPPTGLNQDIHHLAGLSFSVLPHFNNIKLAQEY